MGRERQSVDPGSPAVGVDAASAPRVRLPSAVLAAPARRARHVLHGRHDEALRPPRAELRALGELVHGPADCRGAHGPRLGERGALARLEQVPPVRAGDGGRGQGRARVGLQDGQDGRGRRRRGGGRV